jgi:hypothetical protein
MHVKTTNHADIREITPPTQCSDGTMRNFSDDSRHAPPNLLERIWALKLDGASKLQVLLNVVAILLSREMMTMLTSHRALSGDYSCNDHAVWDHAFMTSAPRERGYSQQWTPVDRMKGWYT